MKKKAARKSDPVQSTSESDLRLLTKPFATITDDLSAEEAALQVCRLMWPAPESLIKLVEMPGDDPDKPEYWFRATHRSCWYILRKFTPVNFHKEVWGVWTDHHLKLNLA